MRLFSSTCHLIGNALSSFSGRKFLVFLFFLALSSIFWLMMTLNETYEVELPIAVQLTGVPKNVVMTSAMSDTVRVTVRDKGYTLLSYEAYNTLRPVRLAFATYANRKTGQGQVPQADIQKMVRQQLYGSSVIVGVKADKLAFTFNFGQSKNIRIKVVGHIVPGEKHYLSHVMVQPSYATVYASKETLDKTDVITTQTINLTNFTDTVTRTVRLETIEGAKIVPTEVTVTFYTDVLTEGSVEVPITAVNKPANLTIRTFPQSVRVIYNVGSSAYRHVKATDFEVVADYKEIAAHPSDKCNLKLRNHSRFAHNARLETSQVDYLIEQQ